MIRTWCSIPDHRISGKPSYTSHQSLIGYILCLLCTVGVEPTQGFPTRRNTPTGAFDHSAKYTYNQTYTPIQWLLYMSAPSPRITLDITSTDCIKSACATYEGSSVELRLASGLYTICYLFNLRTYAHTMSHLQSWLLTPLPSS